MPKTVETKISWEDLEVAEEPAQIHQDLCEEITEWEEGNEPVPTRCKCCVKSEMDSLIIDWIPELIEEVIVDWHRPRIERWYIMPGLGPVAEQMHRDIQQEIARRSLEQSMGNLRTAVQSLVDSVTASFNTFFKACSLLFEVRVLCVWDEFIWNIKNKIKRQRGMESWEIHLTNSYLQNLSRRPTHPMTEVQFNDLRARGQAVVPNYIGGVDPAHELGDESGILDLGTLTEEEFELFRSQWASRTSRMLAFCTPSRFGLTGRQ